MKRLLDPHGHAVAIMENAAQRGGDLNILAGAAIYIDIRFRASEADMETFAYQHQNSSVAEFVSKERTDEE